MKRALAVLTAVAALVVIPASSARPEPVFSDFVRHPSIAAQPESGQWIKDLAVKDGEIYMGYGDYSGNTGPIDIATADLTTGATSVKATANTEEINTYRTYNGHLYVPWVDPTVVAGPYSSDQTGTWVNTENTEAVHIFDVAVLPNGVQVAVGSSNNLARTQYLGATAWVSYDNGLTWRVEMTDLDADVSGYERYYWVAVIGGKAYMQAQDSIGTPKFPVRIFNGSQWTSAGKSSQCVAWEGHSVEVFNGNAYCGNGVVFNGKRSTTQGGIHASDFYQHAGVLYALASGKVMQLVNGSWVQIATAPNDRARSLAVTDTHIYVGDGYGWVRRAAR